MLVYLTTRQRNNQTHASLSHLPLPTSFRVKEQCVAGMRYQAVFGNCKMCDRQNPLGVVPILQEFEVGKECEDSS